MASRIYFLFIFEFLFLFASCQKRESQFAPLLKQEKFLVIRAHKSHGFSFYDFDGRLKFTLPPDHLPSVEGTHLLIPEENFYVVDFTYGALPVWTSNGFYLIDKDGTQSGLVKGRFRMLTGIENGYMRAYRFINERDWVVEYYDVKGQRRFGQTVYSYGEKVIDNHALAKDQKGVWVLVNADGKIVKNISEKIAGSIKSYGNHNALSWTLHVESPKEGSKRIYVVPDGEIRLKDTIPTNSQEYEKEKRLTIFADSNARANNFPHRYRFVQRTVVGDKLIFIGDPDSSGHRGLFDQYLNEIILENDGITTLVPLRFNGEYVVAEEWLGKQYLSHKVFDLKTGKLSGVLPQNWDMVVDNLFIYHVPFVYGIIIEKIINVEGKTVYQLPVEYKYYLNVKSAIAERGNAKILQLDRIHLLEMYLLDSMNNLEIFELHSYKYDRLPDYIFNQSDKLKYIEFINCPNLVALPESMKGLKNLNHLKIVNCRKLEGLENWLQYWPSMRKAEFGTFYNLPEEIRKKYPNIMFE